MLAITCFVGDVHMCYWCYLFQVCQLLLFTHLQWTGKKCIKNACICDSSTITPLHILFCLVPNATWCLQKIMYCKSHELYIFQLIYFFSSHYANLLPQLLYTLFPGIWTFIFIYISDRKRWYLISFYYITDLNLLM